MSAKATTTTVDQELGVFSALASAWDTDREGDVIAATAFDKTIRAWQRSGKNLPLLHEHSTVIVGAIDPFSMDVTDEGLVVSGEIDHSTEEGKQSWRAIKSGVAGFSIGFISKDAPRKGGGRLLLEVDLLEISVTTKPVHPSTRALSWKSADHVGDLADLGLSGALGGLGKSSNGNGAADMIKIVSRHGGTEWLRLGEPAWWEIDQEEEIAELEREARPVVVKSFEI